MGKRRRCCLKLSAIERVGGARVGPFGGKRARISARIKKCGELVGAERRGGEF
jgi:hypothetical protein